MSTYLPTRVRTLYVRPTNADELIRHGWPLKPVQNWLVYIQCDVEGNVNWDKASVYSVTELIERNNVKII